MKFNETYAYSADFADVWRMYSDPEFTKDRLKEGKIDGLTVEVTADSAKLTITAKGSVPASALPDKAARFIKGGVKLQVTQTWTKTSESSADGTMEIAATGAPVQISAHCGLKQDVARLTTVTMSGDLRVTIPLLGQRIEREAMSFVPILTKGDVAAAVRWQAAN